MPIEALNMHGYRVELGGVTKYLFSRALLMFLIHVPSRASNHVHGEDDFVDGGLNCPSVIDRN